MSLARRIAASDDNDGDFAQAFAVLEALDASRMAITVFDSRHRLIHANAQYNYLFRSLPPNEALIGLSYEALVRLEIAGGEIAHSALVDGEDAFVTRRLAQFTPGEYRAFDVPRADGKVIEIKARQAKSGGWIALWNDATEARHNFMRLEDAIALSADAFAFFDLRDRLAMCNALYAQFHGAAQPSELSGRPYEDIVRRTARRGPFQVDGDPQRWSERLFEAHQAPAGALTLSTRSGNAYVVRDRATRDGGRVIVFTDTTDRRRAEATVREQKLALSRTESALAKSRDEIEQKERFLADLNAKLGAAETGAQSAKTTFLRTMSHELKTPLNAIIGFSDLMQRMAGDLAPEQVAEYAGLIHQGGHTLLKLITQILDLTRIAAGRYDLTRVPVDAHGVLRATRSEFESRAAEKAIAIEIAHDPSGLRVLADESALATICGQLVENAVRFTPAGGRVVLKALEAAGRVHLVVEDNGPGVATGDLARILKPFEQSPGNGATQHAYGAGLGLTLVKELAELNGGSLRVASVPGEGFRATIELQPA